MPSRLVTRVDRQRAGQKGYHLRSGESVSDKLTQKLVEIDRTFSVKSPSKQQILTEWYEALDAGTLNDIVKDITSLGDYGWRLHTRLGEFDFWPTTGKYIYRYPVPGREEQTDGTIVGMDELRKMLKSLP